MLRPQLLLLASALLAVRSAGAAVSAPWLTVPDQSDPGVWFTLLPGASGRDFWLRPRPSLSRAGLTLRPCGALRLSVDLWDGAGRSLSRSRAALMAAGHCRPARPCRVAPFPTRRLRVRDQTGRWSSAEPWRFIGGPLPPRLRFVLRPTPNAPTPANCSDLPLGPTSPLHSLVLELMPATARADCQRRPETLSFDAADVVWAAKSLGMSLKKRAMFYRSEKQVEYMPSAVDRDGLRSLVGTLLASKLRAQATLGLRRSPEPSPELQRRTEMALVTRQINYDRRAGVPMLRRLRPGSDRTVFVLRSLRLGQRFEVTEPATATDVPDLVRMSLAMTAAVRRSLEAYGATTVSPPSPTAALRRTTSSRRRARETTTLLWTTSTANSRRRAERVTRTAWPWGARRRTQAPNTTASTGGRKATTTTTKATVTTSRRSRPPQPSTTTANTTLSTKSPASASSSRVKAFQRRLQRLERLLGRFLNSSVPAAWRTARRNATPTTAKPNGPAPIRDCSEAKATGVFLFRGLNTSAARLVRCTADGQLVALSRSRGDVDFDRPWSDYVRGFGNVLRGDYWIGLRFLAAYTARGDRCMQLRLRPWRLNVFERVARYADVQIGPAAELYRLRYSKYRGNNLTDGLADMNGQPFTTKDRDHDAFVANCAQRFGGGNWYKSCYTGNIFGLQKFTPAGPLNLSSPRAQLTDGMCWRGIARSQGSMCSPLESVQMLLSATEQMKARTVVASHIADSNNCRCVSSRKNFTVTATGLYYVTVGGGAGGSNQWAVGGRGATVRATIRLRKGDRLMAVAGCGGAPGYQAGHGGNATWLFDVNRRKLLLVAGGGGGSGLQVPGGHGRAVKTGGRAWWRSDGAHSPTDKQILHPSGPRGGGKPFKLPNGNFATGFRSRTYRYATEIYGGGGGGGYQGGESGTKLHVGGGGGGSFCDLSRLLQCEKEEGGNRRQVGYFIMEKNICF